MFIAILTAMALLSSVQSTDTERILSVIEAAYSPVRSISCDYSYTKSVSLLEEELKASGRVMIDRASGRLEWYKTEPSCSSLLFASGDVQGTSITKDNKQIYRKISKFIESYSESFKIADPKEFDITASETSQEYLLTMIPRPGSTAAIFGKITLCFAKKGTVLNRIKLEDQYGDVTIINLSSVKITR